MASKKKTAARSKVTVKKTKSAGAGKASPRASAGAREKKSVARPRKTAAAKAKPRVVIDERLYYVSDKDNLEALYENLYSDLSIRDRKDLPQQRFSELGCFIACHVAHYLTSGGRMTQEMYDKWFNSPVLALTIEVLDAADRADGDVDTVGLPV